jgi:hypothetical protein
MRTKNHLLEVSCDTLAPGIRRADINYVGQPLAYRPAPAARACAISRSELYLAIASGQLVAHKHGSKTIILAEDLLTFLRALPTISPRTTNHE